jgi:hypothetical protein
MRLPSPISLSCGSSKGCVGANINSTTARHRATTILDLIQTDLLLQSRLDQRSRGHHRSLYVYECYEVLPLVALSRCASVVALESWRQDLHDLEVGYVGFIINACVVV